MATKRANVGTNAAGKKPVKTVKKESVDSDVESEGESVAKVDAGKKKIGGLHYTSNVVTNAYNEGRF